MSTTMIQEMHVLREEKIFLTKQGAITLQVTAQ